MKDAVAHFTLSGDYTVTLTVVGADGQTYSCTWVQHIIGPGVRFELCWDNSDSSDDIDLHVHKPGTTTKWFCHDGSDDQQQPRRLLLLQLQGRRVSDAARRRRRSPTGATPTRRSPSASARPKAPTWMSNLNACHNPRLDIDNVGDAPGTPENINIDNPTNGNSFRAAVHYYRASSTTDEHPMVNIYCGGTLKATFGKAPDTLAGFNSGYGTARAFCGASPTSRRRSTPSAPPPTAP